MFRALIAVLFVMSFPLMAYAAAASVVGDASATPALQWAMALMQLYLSSMLPPIEKRLKRVEKQLHDFIAGIVR